MYVTILALLTGIAIALMAVAAVSSDVRYLVPAGILFILTGLLVMASGVQIPTGTEKRVPSPTTRESAAALTQTIDEFGVATVKNYDTVFDLESTKPISIRRDHITESGDGGTVYKQAGEYVVQTAASGTGQITLDSAEHSAYSSGKVALFGIGVRTPVNFNTSTAAWRAGNFDDDNGLYLGQDSNGTFAAIRYNGSVAKKVYRPNWNGYNQPINFSTGVIIQGRWIYYGYGGQTDAALYVMPDNNTATDPLPGEGLKLVHRFDVTGRTTFTSTAMPVRATVSYSGVNQPQRLYVGGRHFSILGEYTQLSRITRQNNTVTVNSSSDWTPVVTWRHAPDEQEIRAAVNGFSALSACNAEWQWRLHRPSAVQGTPTWQTPYATPDDETVMEVAVGAAVPDTAGILIDSGYLVGDKNDIKVGGAGINTQLPQELYATLYLKRYSGTQDCVIEAKTRVDEAW